MSRSSPSFADLSAALDSSAREAAITISRYSSENGNRLISQGPTATIIKRASPKPEAKVPTQTETKSTSSLSTSPNKSPTPKPATVSPSTLSKTPTPTTLKSSPSTSVSESTPPAPPLTKEELEARDKQLAELSDLVETKIRVELTKATKERDHVNTVIKEYEELRQNILTIAQHIGIIINKDGTYSTTSSSTSPATSSTTSTTPSTTTSNPNASTVSNASSSSSSSSSASSSSSSFSSSSSTSNTKVASPYPEPGISRPLETQVPLGAGVLAEAIVPDPSRIFIEVGLGFHAEMTLPEAYQFVNKKTQLLEKEQNRWEDQISKLATRMSIIYEGMRLLVGGPQHREVQLRPTRQF